MEPADFTDFTDFTEKFSCNFCDIKCSRASEWLRHLGTRKHKRKESGEILEGIFTTKKIYKCECAKEYKTHSGLWKHKNICTYKPAVETANETTDDPVSEPVKKPKLYEKEDIVDVLLKENLDFKNIILELVKNNSDLQKQMLEVCKINTTTINNNSHNKTFNLQVFLNEKCKDAMNLVDFVNSMTLELEDLEEVGKLGYVEGISNIIIRKLNALDIYNRPIHCSDGKREIMFVKDDNVWAKENSTYDKLRKAIKSVTYKNSALLDPWSQKYPNCLNNQHHLNDVYVQMLGQAMGGRESFLESENKIMKKIAKAVLIDKTMA